MAIFDHYGMPVQIEQAEKRRRWGVKKSGRYDVYDRPPTAKEKRGAKEVYEFDLWWVRVRCLGPYPDGSGAHLVGQMLEGRDDLTNRGFRPEILLRATDGIREIHDTCEALAADRGKARQEKKKKVLSAINKEMSKALFGPWK